MAVVVAMLVLHGRHRETKKSPEPLGLGAESTVRGGGGDNWCATVLTVVIGLQCRPAISAKHALYVIYAALQQDFKIF